MDREYFSTLDAYLAAFITLQGIRPYLRINSHKVSFNFPISPKLTAIICEYNTGAKVDALIFANTIKNLKALVFEMKDRG
jgi:hypothetical protein